MSEKQKADPIGKVHLTAAYELVVDQIRRVIYLGRYLPGDRLPPERELAQQLGVSRTTVREAVRLLEGEKLITVKRGATGGIIVLGADDGADKELRSISAAHLRELEEIFEFRVAVECCAVRLAAERRTKKHIATLRRAADQMERIAAASGRDGGSIAEYNAADTQFHITIAEAAGNRYLRQDVEEIRAAMFRPVGSIFEGLTERVDVHHHQILAAIVNRDPDAAEAHMREHIQVGFGGLKTLVTGRGKRKPRRST